MKNRKGNYGQYRIVTFLNTKYGVPQNKEISENQFRKKTTNDSKSILLQCDFRSSKFSFRQISQQIALASIS